MPDDVREPCAIFSSKSGVGPKGTGGCKRLFSNRLSLLNLNYYEGRRIGTEFEKIC
jgi:hypothetical protein